MKTEDLVKQLRERAEWIGKLDILDSRNTCALMTAAIDKIQELTPKHDPTIEEEIAFLRRAERSTIPMSDRRTASRIANRLEAMNPPPPPPTVGQLRDDLYRLVLHMGTTDESNRAKLEAAIKILAG